jgi:hypothetical protein
VGPRDDRLAADPQQPWGLAGGQRVAGLIVRGPGRFESLVARKR